MTPCSIRPYQPDDAKALYAAVRESLSELAVWMDWCHPEYGSAQARDWTASRQELAAQGVEYSFAILGPTGEFAGGCGINQLNRVHRLGNLGYWLRTSMTGQGVATAAVKLLTEWAFRHTDLLRLEIVCAVGNKKSQAVAERVGAVREGVLRDRLLIHGQSHDAVMYSIVRS